MHTMVKSQDNLFKSEGLKSNMQARNATRIINLVENLNLAFNGIDYIRITCHRL